MLITVIKQLHICLKALNHMHYFMIMNYHACNLQSVRSENLLISIPTLRFAFFKYFSLSYECHHLVAESEHN